MTNDFFRNIPTYQDDSDFTTNAESYYKDLARKQKLIKLLAEKIWKYENTLKESLESIEQRLTDYIAEKDQVLADTLQKWDDRIANLDKEVSHIFVEWLNDGTLEQIINHEVLGSKADQSELDKTNTQLAQNTKKLFNDYSDVSIDEAKDAFIQAMNDKAKRIGMTNTHYNNPHGLQDLEQLSTANDSVLMGIHAMSYDEIAKVWGRQSYSVDVKGANARKQDITSTVILPELSNYYTIMGGKTGGNDSENQNILAVVRSPITDKWYVGAVFGANENRHTVARRLFNVADRQVNTPKPLNPVRNLIVNAGFESDLDTWTVNAGTPTVSTNDFYDGEKSLQINSTGTSSQINKTIKLEIGHVIYISAWVKVSRHVAGSAGFQLALNEGEPINGTNVTGVNNKWELVSARFEASEIEPRLHVGGISQANLDGYVDAITLYDLTAFYGEGNEPTKEQMDALMTNNVNSNMASVALLPEHNPLSINESNLSTLWSKRGNEQLRQASITKVMTAMLMLDNVDNLDEEFELIDSDIQAGSGGTFYAGDIVTFRDALYLMMLPSSNTMAEATSRVIGQRIVGKKQFLSV